MPTNYGFLKEDEMVHHLNGIKIKDLSNNLRNLMRDLFGVLDDEEVVHARKTDDFIKPDFIIEYRNEKKYVSMKSGKANVVHSEIITTFTAFLLENGISKETVETILLYQFGDGTTDGTGKKRLEYDQLRFNLSLRIKKANKELNADNNFIMKVIDRCVFVGTLPNAIPADCIYHGNYEFGMVATKRQFEKHIMRRNWNYINNLHIGPLQLRPHARYINSEIVSEKRRRTVDCYWPYYNADIEFISRRYDF